MQGKKKKTYGCTALDGDFEEPGMVFPPFEAKRGAIATFLVLELKEASQLIKKAFKRSTTYTAASKTS
jgi:hypothetical protein